MWWTWRESNPRLAQEFCETSTSLVGISSSPPRENQRTLFCVAAWLLYSHRSPAALLCSPNLHLHRTKPDQERCSLDGLMPLGRSRSCMRLHLWFCRRFHSLRQEYLLSRKSLHNRNQARPCFAIELCCLLYQNIYAASFWFTLISTGIGRGLVTKRDSRPRRFSESFAK